MIFFKNIKSKQPQLYQTREHIQKIDIIEIDHSNT